jgi:hypothetical protein
MCFLERAIVEALPLVLIKRFNWGPWGRNKKIDAVLTLMN